MKGIRLSFCSIRVNSFLAIKTCTTSQIVSPCWQYLGFQGIDGYFVLSSGNNWQQSVDEKASVNKSWRFWVFDLCSMHGLHVLIIQRKGEVLAHNVTLITKILLAIFDFAFHICTSNLWYNFVFYIFQAIRIFGGSLKFGFYIVVGWMIKHSMFFSWRLIQVEPTFSRRYNLQDELTITIGKIWTFIHYTT